MTSLTHALHNTEIRQVQLAEDWQLNCEPPYFKYVQLAAFDSRRLTSQNADRLHSESHAIMQRILNYYGPIVMTHISN